MPSLHRTCLALAAFWTLTFVSGHLLAFVDCSGTYSGGGNGPPETGVECEDYLDANNVVRERRASYWVPAANPGTGTYPVVVAFHGGNGGEWDCANNMDLNDLYAVAGREFILVCPRPMQMLSGSKGWMKHFGKHGSHDPALHLLDDAFIRDLIGHFTNGVTFHGDPSRVFLVGFSGAAAFVHGFAAQHSGDVSAAMMMAGPVAGLQNDGLDDPVNGVISMGGSFNSAACAANPACIELDVANSIYPDERGTKAVGAVPSLLIHSFGDTAKPYHGGTAFDCGGYTTAADCNEARRARVSFSSNFLYPGAMSTTGWWVQNNGCSAGVFNYTPTMWNSPTGVAVDYGDFTFSGAGCSTVRSITIWSGWDHVYQHGTLGNFSTNGETLAFFDTYGGGLGWMP
jgi:poly(3-hydroxybutyrate) depolymerase